MYLSPCSPVYINLIQSDPYLYKAKQSANPMPKHPSPQSHRSFLLRCWQARTHDDLETMHWHFSLREVAETPQEQSFSTLGQLLDFLLAKLGKEESG